MGKMKVNIKLWKPAVVILNCGEIGISFSKKFHADSWMQRKPTLQSFTLTKKSRNRIGICGDFCVFDIGNRHLSKTENDFD